MLHQSRVALNLATVAYPCSGFDLFFLLKAVAEVVFVEPTFLLRSSDYVI